MMRPIPPLLLFAATSLHGQVAANWAGVLDFPQSRLHFILHITRRDSDLHATADSPDQGLSGIPLDSMANPGQTLLFSITALNLSWRGRIEADSIKRVFTQNGYQTELDLQRK
jgi:hypothetical protein